MQKSIFIVIALIFSLFHTAYGQKFMIGPKGGVNLGGIQYVGDEMNEEYKSIPSVGMQGGIVLHLPVSNSVSLQTELNYTRRNISVRHRTDTFFYHKGYHDHLELPVLFQYKFGPQFFRMYVNAGPSFSYWTGGRGKIQMREMDFLSFEKQPYDVIFRAREEVESDFNMYTTNVRRFQINLNFGLGMYMELVNEHVVMFDFRFRQGQTRVGKYDSGDLNILGYKENLNYLSWDVAFNVGYLIPFDVKQWYKGRSTIKAKSRF